MFQQLLRGHEPPRVMLRVRDADAPAMPDHQIEVPEVQVHQKDHIGEEQHSLLSGLLKTEGTEFVDLVRL